MNDASFDNSHLFQGSKTPGRRLVLVIEDNDLNREILCDLLFEEYDVIQACDGEEGLQMLSRHYRELSAVLLDVYMPKCNGFEFLERIKDDELLSSVPIIITTASDKPEDEVRCLRMGASDFVSKPYNPDVVLGRINSTIRLRESESTLSAVERDSITGAYTVAAFCHHVDESMRQSSMPYDILVAKCRGLHLLRQAYGSQKTMEIMKEVVNKLYRWQPKGFVARKESSFFVFYPSSERPTEEAINQSINAACLHLGISNVYFSIGLYEDVDSTKPASTLMERAEQAAASITDDFTTMLSVYDSEMEERELREMDMEVSFSDALSKGEFIAWYQPKINAESGEIVAAEALVRWIDSAGNFFSPGEFISLFERNGLISQLDEHVFHQVCSFQRIQMEQGRPLVPISVNLSRNSLFKAGVVDRYLSIIRNEHVPISLIPLEITESAAANENLVVGICQQFVDAGFTLHLDDFGAGYSAISSLITFPVKELKLDKTMVDHIGSPKGDILLKNTIKVAHDLDISVVAEGVETKTQLQFLTQSNCDIIQGYYFSKPVDETKFIEMLDRCFALNKVKDIENKASMSSDIINSLEFKRYLKVYRSVFPAVRTFDGVLFSCSLIDEDGTAGEKHPCFEAWSRNGACENCIVKTTMSSHETTRKYEVIGECLYLVIAKFLQVDGKPVVVELIDKVGSEVLHGLQKDPAFLESVKEINQELYHDIQLDVMNRRYYEERFAFLEDITALAMIDLDRFKNVNDVYGHHVGDKVLKAVADTIKNNIRGNDKLIRYGGDELLIAFQGMDHAFLKERLENIRKAVSELVFEESPDLSITVSIGGYGCDECTAAAVQVADEQMYLAKRTRNAVCVKLG